MKLPQHLEDTAELIHRAFPQVISESEYLPLLLVISGHLSNRNAVELFVSLTAKEDWEVWNDVLTVQSEPSRFSLGNIPDRLRAAGFDEWLTRE